jgi:hypothetical protein
MGNLYESFLYIFFNFAPFLMPQMVLCDFIIYIIFIIPNEIILGEKFDETWR